MTSSDASASRTLTLRESLAQATTHHRAGNLPVAAQLYQAILTAAPQHAESWHQLGLIHLQQGDLGRPREALAAYDHAAQLQPNYPEAHRGRAHSLSQLSRLQDALAAIDQVLALLPEDIASHIQRIVLLKRLDRLDSALTASDEALARFPQEAALSITRGGVHKAQGRIDAACADYQRALTLQPHNVEALINLIQERRLPPDYPALAPLQAALQQPRLDVVRRKDLHFALATLHDQRHETDAAFHHYQAGHAARAEHLRHRYDTQQARARLTRLCQTCTKDFFTARRDWGHPSTRPIFILGMPRSGNTLTEQILASHPAVAAGGELPDIARLAQRWTRRPEALTATEVQHLAERYLERLTRIDPDAPHVTDKMPHNFEHLWLIALLFPQATVLHCQRDPLATCLVHLQPQLRHRSCLRR
ncbi:MULTISPECIES: tetratricopeptide repeat-containing sulfotransferase family protein [Thiorhodovibrio]|uniref:tetratricopeptide repeat-containing sulfotransferase family protein n=1 Tax=Thiorhodovibrio TaxID=61593 RepID=UPI0019114D71|nr:MULTISPECIES: tetratricopeptide repeat-containing sulfotransferase family protein [Thiorhodovibrio]